MSQKTDCIESVQRLAKLISESYRGLNAECDKYKDNGWTVGGGDEIIQTDIDTAGFQFTPAVSDHDKKLNALL